MLIEAEEEEELALLVCISFPKTLSLLPLQALSIHRSTADQYIATFVKDERDYGGK